MALTAIHIIVFLSVLLLRKPLGLEKLNDIVVIITIYLPLFPWKLIDAPFFETTNQMIPPPNIVGWGIVVLSWVLLYLVVGYLLSGIVKRFK